VLILLRRYGIRLINGAPRTPQTQGLVEQANGVVEVKIAKYKAEHGTPYWEFALPEICMQMNSSYHCSLKCTPFEVVFRSRAPVNWLSREERLSAKGVECKAGNSVVEGAILTKEVLNEELAQLAAKSRHSQSDLDTLEALKGLRDIGIEIPIIVDAPETSGAAIIPIPDQNPAVTSQPEKTLPPTDPATSAYLKVSSPPKSLPVSSPPASPLSPLPSEESDEVILTSKPSTTQPEHFLAGRPIARATIAQESLKFHGQQVPEAHSILFFLRTLASETMSPIPGGQLDYTDPIEGCTNLSEIIEGQLVHWPKDLLIFDRPDNFQGDLQALLSGPAAGDFSSKETSQDKSDEVLQRPKSIIRKLAIVW
jgi:hypothetical protein